MKTQSNAAGQIHDEQPIESKEGTDASELSLPFADGGYGPLDSDDIEWLIESGTYPMPGQKQDHEGAQDAA